MIDSQYMQDSQKHKYIDRKYQSKLAIFFIRYAPLKQTDRVNGGRPDHFAVETPTYSPKLMVFCGMKYELRY